MGEKRRLDREGQEDNDQVGWREKCDEGLLEMKS